MSKSYISFKAPALTGKVLKTGSNCAFDPVSLLSVPDDPACSCKQGNKVQAGADGTYFVKRYTHKTFWDSFRHLFKRSRPEHCLTAALKLKNAGLDTPAVFAVLRRKNGFLPEFDYLITEDISKDCVFADKMPLSRELISNLCRLLGDLHRAGVIHGDVNLRNLYRKSSGIWGVIDLDGCCLSSRPIGIRGRKNELARLASSFIRLIPYRGAAEDLPEDLPGVFAEEYKKYTGISVDSHVYRFRTGYLSQRKRK